MKKTVIFILFINVLTACTVHMDSLKIGTANPASEFCLAQKGFLDFQKDTQGNSVGMCHLPNGQVVEEWQYYREHHK